MGMISYKETKYTQIIPVPNKGAAGVSTAGGSGRVCGERRGQRKGSG